MEGQFAAVALPAAESGRAQTPHVRLGASAESPSFRTGEPTYQGPGSRKGPAVALSDEVLTDRGAVAVEQTAECCDLTNAWLATRKPYDNNFICRRPVALRLRGPLRSGRSASGTAGSPLVLRLKLGA